MAARIIGKEQAAAAGRWSAPAVDAPRNGSGTGRDHEEAARRAREEAERKGYADGLAAGREEAAKRARYLAKAADSLARPLDNVDQAVERELVELAIALASHLVRRELAVDRQAVTEAARELLAALPSATRDVVLHVHPDDAPVITEHLEPDTPRPWRLALDASLARGDLRVTSESSRIDGSLETRLREVVRAALAGLGEDAAQP